MTAEPGRVSTLELFFDLVFVFTITQLTTVLARGPQPEALLRVSLMLGVIFWMYGGYAWLTNAVEVDRLERRLLLVGGMAAFLVLALAVPRAFDGSGAAFGGAYVVIVAIHSLLYLKSSSEGSRRGIRSIAPFNATTALLVLAAGIAGGTAEYVLWGLAFVLEWFTPLLGSTGSFDIAPAHFVERHGLVVIVAIGESVVAVGIGARHLAIDLPLVGVAVLGLLLSTALWWTYFGGDDDERAERALAEASPAERGWLAIRAFGYCHLALLLGVIAVAAGLKTAIAAPFEALAVAPAVELAGGVALFMAGDVLFRRSLGLVREHWRGAAAVLALATIPLGHATTATAQLAALVVLLAAALAAEAQRLTSSQSDATTSTGSAKTVS